MKREYYTIIRKYYGFPDYFDVDLSEKEDCFTFETENEVKKCLRDMFANSEWMKDQKYGKIRYYIERKTYA